MDLEDIAREMKAAQDSATQIPPLTARFASFDEPAAYEVARSIHEARRLEGASPVGRKIGFTNPGMWREHGVRSPIWSWVYDTTVVQLSGERADC